MPLVRRSTAERVDAKPPMRDLAQASAALDAFKPGTEKHISTAPPVVPRELSDAEYVRLRDSIKLDKHRLEDNALEHSGVYLEICERSALAQSVLDEVKEYRERVDANIARNKRLNPDKDEKITDKVVDAYVATHAEHIKAAQYFADVWRMQSRWRALERSFEHRKSMIRELASLYASGYWTTASTRSAHGNVEQRNADDVQERLAQQRRDRAVRG